MAIAAFCSSSLSESCVILMGHTEPQRLAAKRITARRGERITGGVVAPSTGPYWFSVALPGNCCGLLAIPVAGVALDMEAKPAGCSGRRHRRRINRESAHRGDQVFEWPANGRTL